MITRKYTRSHLILCSFLLFNNPALAFVGPAVLRKIAAYASQRGSQFIAKNPKLNTVVTRGCQFIKKHPQKTYWSIVGSFSLGAGAAEYKAKALAQEETLDDESRLPSSDTKKALFRMSGPPVNSIGYSSLIKAMEFPVTRKFVTQSPKLLMIAKVATNPGTLLFFAAKNGAEGLVYSHVLEKAYNRWMNKKIQSNHTKN